MGAILSLSVSQSLRKAPGCETDQGSRQVGEALPLGSGQIPAFQQAEAKVLRGRDTDAKGQLCPDVGKYAVSLQPEQ